MPFGRFLWLSFLAIGCSSSSELGKPCRTLDGGPPGSGSSAPEAGATGGQSAGGAAGSGGTAASGGAFAGAGGTGGAGGAVRDGAAGAGASGAGGTAAGGESSSGGAGAGGATRGADGGDAGGSGGTSGGAGTGGAAPGDAGSGCGDHVRDGDETGVDCGGSCSPCLAGLPCHANADCPSGPGCDASQGGCVCDRLALVCVPSHCADQRHDGDETDVDCGGSCSGCGPGSLCRSDPDCGGVAVGCGDQCYCDTATRTCVYNDCYDNKTDALETDFDCGGPLCHPCELGGKCLADRDCLSAACDVVTQACIADQCADGRIDGQESDVDCGGEVCSSCALGKKCNSNLDCPSGHVCGGVTKVCQ